jgi:hypothetical protein
MTLKEIVEQLESCGFTCEAGPLENHVAFIDLKEKFSGKNGLSITVDMKKMDEFKNIVNILYQVVTRANDEKITQYVLSELEKIHEPNPPLIPIPFDDLKIESDGRVNGTKIFVNGEKVSNLLSVQFVASMHNKNVLFLGDIFRRKG